MSGLNAARKARCKRAAKRWDDRFHDVGRTSQGEIRNSLVNTNDTPPTSPVLRCPPTEASNAFHASIEAGRTACRQIDVSFNSDYGDLSNRQAAGESRASHRFVLVNRSSAGCHFTFWLALPTSRRRPLHHLLGLILRKPVERWKAGQPDDGATPSHNPAT